MPTQNNHRLKIGIIGSGAIARNRVLPSFLLSEYCELWSIHNRNPETAQQLASQFGASYGNDSIATLLADEALDAVYVASPVDCHLEHALAIAAAGKHLLLEKPLARNADEARQIDEACKQAGIVALEAYMMKFHPAHAMLRELVAKNQLGKVVTARARLGCWYPPKEGAWRQNPERGGGGVLMDIGCHMLDIMRWILGPVHSVSGRAANVAFDYPSDDTAIALVEFKEGGIGIIESYFNLPDEFAAGELEVSGTLGKVVCTGTLGQTGGGSMTIELKQAAESPVQSQTIAFDNPVNLYALQLDHFARCILREQEPFFNTLADGTEILTHLTGIYAQQLVS